MTAVRDFIVGEQGSAAVDWVVMTAAVVALTLAVMNVISDAVEAAGLRLAERLSDMPVRTSFAEWETLRNEMDSAEAGDDVD
jgi:hypothetical protein